MKPSSVVAVLAGVGLLVWGATALAGEKVAEVKIGSVLSLSGGAANQGVQTKAGAIIAADEINAKGGIPALGGAVIKLIFGDSQSKPDVGASETERIIQRENVPLMFGAYQSAVTTVTTEVAERYKTPWLVSGSVADIITQRGFKYTFRPNNMAVYDAESNSMPSRDWRRRPERGRRASASWWRGVTGGSRMPRISGSLSRKRALRLSWTRRIRQGRWISPPRS